MRYVSEVPIDQRVKSLLPGDKDWFINAGNMTIIPRASFQISKECPPEYATVIYEAVRLGWLKPVAHIKQSEYIWEQLGE